MTAHEDFPPDTTEEDLIARWEKARYKVRFMGAKHVNIRMSRDGWDAMLTICEEWADEHGGRALPPAIPER